MSAPERKPPKLLNEQRGTRNDTIPRVSAERATDETPARRDAEEEALLVALYAAAKRWGLPPQKAGVMLARVLVLAADAKTFAAELGKVFRDAPEAREVAREMLAEALRVLDARAGAPSTH